MALGEFPLALISYTDYTQSVSGCISGGILLMNDARRMVDGDY